MIMNNRPFIRNEALSFFTKDDGRVIVFNHSTSNSHILRCDAYQILLSMDGINTLDDIYGKFAVIPKAEIDQLVDMFIELGLVGENHTQKKHVVRWRNPENCFILKNKIVCDIIRIIISLSPLLFFIELYCFRDLILYYLRNLTAEMHLGANINPFSIFAMILTLIISILLHEVAHAIFAKSYNANVGEIVLAIRPVFPVIHIYTSICGLSYVRKAWHKIQIHMAGFLMHILLVDLGILMIGCSNDFIVTSGLYVFVLNSICALGNLIPTEKSDGGHILRTMVVLRNQYQMNRHQEKTEKKTE